MTRLSIVETIEAHYLTLVIDTLHRLGVLAQLSEPRDAAWLAEALGLDAELLAMLLGWIGERTDLLERRADGRYARADGRPGFLEHMLDQYVGGYGQAVGQLEHLLKGDVVVRPDLERHAHAFSDPSAETGTQDELTGLVLAFGATHVIELGCGGGQRLCALADANSELYAVGIDANPFVAQAARATISQRNLDYRLSVLIGDALDQLESMGGSETCQMVIASSLLNEYWSEEGELAHFLTRLGTLLPGRILLVSDYYSRLGLHNTGERPARTLLHDLAQLASGQGLPPPDAERWTAAYREAGAELLQSIEASGDGIERFIHIVKLAG